MFTSNRAILTITKSGQITLPKAFRDFLGVKPGDQIVISRNIADESISIERLMSAQEILAKMDARRTPEELAAIEKNRGKTAREMTYEWMDSPEGKAYFKEKYGL